MEEEKKVKKENRGQHVSTKMSALSLRLPQSGSDTLVDSVPLLYVPAHMFFLDTFFLDSFPEDPHPST